MRRILMCVLVACSGGQSSDPAPAKATSQSELDRAIDQLAEQTLERVSEKKQSKVAVNEFLTLKGETTDLGKYISEELATRLIRSGKVQVVERRLLQKVLSEQEMGASNLVDDETAARVGKLLGADTLCLGTMTDLGTTIKVNARLINADTAEAYGAASADLPKNRQVLALVGGGGVSKQAVVVEQPPAKGHKMKKEPEPEPEAKPQAAITVGPTAPSKPVTAADTSDMIVYLKKSPYVNPIDVVLIVNKSNYCVKFWMNGKALKIYDGTLEVPCAPNKSKAFVKLPAFGEYQLQASGSSTPFPFKGIAAYMKNHTFPATTKKKEVVLNVNEFYAVNQ